MNDGETRNAYRSVCAISVSDPVGVIVGPSLTILSNAAISSVVSARRNALRPNLMIVSCKQVLPSPVGVHAMKFFFRVASADDLRGDHVADRLVAAPAEVGEAARLIGREDRRRLHAVRRRQRLHAEQIADHAVVLRVAQARDLRRDRDAARVAERDAVARRAGDHRAGAAGAADRR